jgi:DMSO reductase family type II enzyme heme b subunit
VHLWIWKADKARVDEAIARGWKQPVRIQPKEQQQTASKAEWKDGRWTIVMKRPLVSPDRNDVGFRKGKFIPMAVNAWDGSNGEHGLIMSLSTWYFVLLEAPTPISVYVLTLLAIVLTGGLGIWLVRKAQDANSDSEEKLA